MDAAEIKLRLAIVEELKRNLFMNEKTKAVLIDLENKLKIRMAGLERKNDNARMS